MAKAQVPFGLGEAELAGGGGLDDPATGGAATSISATRYLTQQ